MYKHRAVHTNTKLKKWNIYKTPLYFSAFLRWYIFLFKEKKQTRNKNIMPNNKKLENETNTITQNAVYKFWYSCALFQCILRFFSSYKSCFRIYKTRVNAVRITIELTRCCFFLLFFLLYISLIYYVQFIHVYSFVILFIEKKCVHV